ncbi:SapC family protein [Litorisediminicola beolgyonensis]|uniref:SapC family protein n=1 Tax=Litorisediminicola beolgyonensis TaxID=1173614 RepID=A0ABW3ZER0_9RHOB
MSESSAAPGLYTQVEPLTQARHQRLGFVGDGSYAFARSLVSVPASLSEMVLLQRHMPLVFAGEDRPVPIAVMGLEAAQGGLFIDAAGRWMPGISVPAFLRRYPFIAIPKPNGKELVLAVDLASDLVADDAPHPLFERGQPSDRAQAAFALATRLHHDFDAAREVGAALAEADLLVPQSAELTLADGRKIGLRNFRVVDEERLAALPDAVFLEWRRRGWLPAIHAHLMSQAAWTELARLA